MDVKDYIDKELTCVISKEYESEGFYVDTKFKVKIISGPTSEDECKTFVFQDGEYVEWEPYVVESNLVFGNWVVKKVKSIKKQ